MRKVVIIDNAQINRQTLKKMIEKEYDVIEADSEKNALKMLDQDHKVISAVIINLTDTSINTYNILHYIYGNAVISHLPVIAVTDNTDENSKIKALSLGVSSFITMPYTHDSINLYLRNIIMLREKASVVNALECDKLTGVYNREFFFDKAADIIKTHPPGSFIMSCLDIDNFKLINDKYGAAEGDRILRCMGATVKEVFHKVNGISARISSDNFVGLFPNTPEIIEYVSQARDNFFVCNNINVTMTFSVGRYIVSDIDLPVSAMYDRAYIAKQSIKGMYDKHTAYFDKSMLDRLIQEQKIVSDMGKALTQNQFEVWLQPQINHSSGALIGAESLVRWRHPEDGLISPGVFIPIFEQNGFIYELDKYVWENTCRYLRKWIDEGRNPMPVSVNISRYDIFKDDLTDVINGLISKYDLRPELLRLEITESAFAKSTQRIISVVKQLTELGFTIEIDDFGSGYSSLTTLKDVPADVIKLDMRFLEDNGDSGRGGNILESVVRMARWIGMSVLAEGVEEKAQADFLKSIGCNYIQGYFYSKPMPASEYEEFAESFGKEEKLRALETVENLDNNAFWDPKSMDTLIFNTYIGGACIFEYFNGKAELLRATDKFARILGGEKMTIEKVLKLDWMKYLEAASYNKAVRVLKTLIDTRGEITEEYVFIDLPQCPHQTFLRVTMRIIACADERYLVYCTSKNVTAQHQAQQKELLDNLPCGAALYEYDGSVMTAVHLNKRYYELVHCSDKEISSMSLMDAVHPDDRQIVNEQICKISEKQHDVSCSIRILYNKNQYRKFNLIGKAVEQNNGKYSVYVAYMPEDDKHIIMQS